MIVPTRHAFWADKPGKPGGIPTRARAKWAVTGWATLTGLGPYAGYPRAADVTSQQCRTGTALWKTATPERKYCASSPNLSD
jgi:hypothetical protein